MSGIRHEIFDPKELESSKKDEVQKIVSLLTKEQISQMFADSQERLLKIQNIQLSVQNDIAKIDRNLRADIVQNRAQEIKFKAQAGIDEALKGVRDNSDLAKAQERFWSPAAVRMRSSFDNDPTKDATISTAWMQKIGKMDGVVLVELAALSAATGNLALAGLIESEMHSRNADGLDPRTVKPYHRNEITRYIDSVPNASTEVLQTLAETQHIVGRAVAAATGRGGSYEKIRQGLLAGGLK